MEKVELKLTMMEEEIGVTEFVRACALTDDTARQHGSIQWLHRYGNGSYFISFRQWNDWLYESHPDGNSFLSDGGLKLAMKLGVAESISVTGYK